MQQEFHRIKRLPPYVFNEVNAMKAKARAAGEDIIDFGMGNPDSPTPAHIVEKLVETVADPRTHRYSASRGIPGLRKAIAAYYGRRFGVEIDAETEAIVTLGSKEGLANLASAITSPGDVILVPNPSYPIHQFGFIIADGAVRNIPVLPDEEFFKALENAVMHSVPKPTAVVLNYPNNPTTATADLAFYERVVDYCRHQGIYILSDLAYAELYFDGNPPPSILQVPGAREIAVEFTSMSKTYSMPGWRIGFATGNQQLISALSRIKSYLDYGAFTPVQVAATAALNGPQQCVDDMRQLYKERRDVLIDSMGQAGWDIPVPTSTMFAWAPVPPAFAHLGSNEFAKLLLREAKVAVSPGVAFGEHGDGHVRVSLVENRQRIRQAARNVKSFFGSYQQVLEGAERRRAVVS
ncbi:MAG: LL-diaminopimelate aminotransferase [Rhodospirillales bacterium]|jgi:alanine-synthesizing transaminase|nr:aminotransferase [Rhodospirillaceae bacterium]MDP6429571.1 LL-diaminopimelate aminotransferase [Rhodospirillales bacterium]MDP6645153.1 LL-diaminopimelate aminotransferase [Rhodospirillales bacterium]MDP6842857.1 LL-diaminopimelate aminotransferase [Rhodospirillales bacterium]|tara:strand:- start:1756 stop:2979 length:1224 start_codon:yes stop_codon:yes gene_type:complete